MSARTIALWALFAFVVWNVAFDRQVSKAAYEFTQQQILRYQRSEPVNTIEEAFRPRVRDAAVLASAWTAGAVSAGLLLSRLVAKSKRS